MRRAVSSVTVALSLLGATVAFPGVALAAAASASSPRAAGSASGPLAGVPAPVAAAAASAPLAVIPASAPRAAAAAWAPLAAAGKKRCTVTDERLKELSGLVATKTGYIVINDGTTDESRKRVFFLNTKCTIAKEPVSYSGAGPFDTEDLALSPDGKTLWIADTGDNVTSKERRSRVAVWSMPVNGSKRPVLHRLSYPDGKPHDAEALLIGEDGNPLVITKVMSGKAEIFTPAEEMKSGDTEAVPMKKVGEISLPKTDTDNRLGAPGRVAITGAARSPDGSRVVVRTYADAFEYAVQGDVVAALTTGKPLVTALADPFGEAIAYTPDGKTFLTVSDGGQLEEGEPIDILSYTPSTQGAKPLADAAGGEKKSDQSWFDGLSLSDITYLIAAVGVIGALMVGVGVVGILRARRRPAADGDDADRDDDRRGRGDNGVLPPDEGFLPPDDRPRGGVYGAAPSGGVYGGPAGAAPAGGRPAAAPSGGGVYGGGRPAGGSGVYGGGRPAGGGSGAYGGRPGGGGRPADGGRPGGGGRGGVYGGGQPGGGGYGGGRAEPPRRGGEPDPRGQRSDRRRDDGYGEGRGGSYGQAPGGGRGHQGDRY